MDVFNCREEMLDWNFNFGLFKVQRVEHLSSTLDMLL